MLARRVHERRIRARELREEAAEFAFLRPHPDHLSNGEELEYRRSDGRLGFIANYSKGLPHNSLGEVDPVAYDSLLRVLDSGAPDRFEQIELGRPDGLNLTNPQAGLAYDLEGPDAQAVTIPPAPRIDGPVNSSEMGELYWMALLRDVPFIDPSNTVNTVPDFDADPRVAQAAASLSPTGDFTAFQGPTDGLGNIIPGTLFRGFARGDLVGPYISQFLLKGTAERGLPQVPDQGTIQYGTLGIDQRQRTLLPPGMGGFDYVVSFGRWLDVQNGRLTFNGVNLIGSDIFDPQRRFIRNLRDLANYVHFDMNYEAYLNACLLLLNMPARLDPGNPYVRSRTQDGLVTFGPWHVLALLAEVTTRALKAVWFQKWGVHRRLRPEEFGGRIEVHRPGGVAPGRYAMIDPEILNSGVLGQIIGLFGNALLPQVFPEGAPSHPAYGAGHATVAGACVTVLKAWFDESEIFDPNVVPPISPNNPSNQARRSQMMENRRPKVPADAFGLTLTDYQPLAPPGEPRLTVGGELNKLAANISIGRNAAGVHWRSDYTESVRLGEEIAIRLLQEQQPTYNEDHHLSLTTFDGAAISI